jgi:hypothetical protein
MGIMRSLRSWMAVAALGLPMRVLACSGPRAFARMEESVHTSYVLSAIALSATIVTWLCCSRVIRFRAHRIASVAASVVNPGWWYRVDGGDCGATRVDAAVFVLVCSALVVFLSCYAVYSIGRERHAP